MTRAHSPRKRRREGTGEYGWRDALETARERGNSTFLDLFHPWEANVWLAIADIEEGDFRRLHNLALNWLSAGRPSAWAAAIRGGQPTQGPLPPVPRRRHPGLHGPRGRGMAGGAAGGRRGAHGHPDGDGGPAALRTGWEPWHGPLYPTSPRCGCGSHGGGHHDLGAQAVRVLLEREGWKVYYLGADVPVEEFAEIQRAQGATLVCISLSPRRTPPGPPAGRSGPWGILPTPVPLCPGFGGSLGEIPRDGPGGPLSGPSLFSSAQEFLLGPNPKKTMILRSEEGRMKPARNHSPGTPASSSGWAWRPCWSSP